MDVIFEPLFPLMSEEIYERVIANIMSSNEVTAPHNLTGRSRIAPVNGN